MREHPALQAWSEVHPQGPLPSSVKRIRTANPRSVVYRLVHAQPGGGSVIAKRCEIGRTAAERAIYQDVLRHLTVRTPRYCGAISPPEGNRGWLFVEEAVGEPYDAENAQHRIAAGRWLALFHVAASTLEAGHRLPSREPWHYLQHLRAARTAIRPHLGHGLLTNQHERAIASLLDRCDLFEARWNQIEAFFANMPRTVVHGDFALDNVRLQHGPDGLTLIPFDWEDAGWGVAATDIAHYTAGASVYAIRPDLAAYQSVASGVWPHLDAHDVHLAAEFGTAFRIFSELWWESWRISYPYRSPREHVWLGEFIESARVYLARMEQVAAVAGWSA